MGFVLSDHQLRRSAMDYWPRLDLTVHDDVEAFLRELPGPLWLFDSAGTVLHWDAPFAPGDTLVFGSETRGLPEDLISRFPGRLLRIPQVPGERCLNLATSVAVALYEALRRTHRNPGSSAGDSVDRAPALTGASET
jgi:tRNA (cytidine/uridine-2'-O-)-methyltransferase